MVFALMSEILRITIGAMGREVQWSRFDGKPPVVQWSGGYYATPKQEDLEGSPKALDGCLVEPDGHCKHGYPAWALVLKGS